MQIMSWASSTTLDIHPLSCPHVVDTSSVLWPHSTSLTLIFSPLSELFTHSWVSCRQKCILPFWIMWIMGIHFSGSLMQRDLDEGSMEPQHSAWWPTDGLFPSPLCLRAGTPYLGEKSNKLVPLLFCIYSEYYFVFLITFKYIFLLVPGFNIGQVQPRLVQDRG